MLPVVVLRRNPSMASGPIRNGWLWWWLADMVAVVLAYYVAISLIFNSKLDSAIFYRLKELIFINQISKLASADLKRVYLNGAPYMIMAMAVVVSLLYGLMQLYEGRRFIRSRAVVWPILQVNLVLFFVGVSYLFVRRRALPRSFWITVVVLNTAFGVFLRHFVGEAVRFVREKFAVGEQNAVIIGNNEYVDRIRYSLIKDNPYGIIITDQLEYSDEDFEDLFSKLRELKKTQSIDMIICALPELGIVSLMRILEFSASVGVVCKLLSPAFDVLRNEAGLKFDVIRTIPLVHFDPPWMTTKDWWVRRALSRVLALLAIILLSPLFLMTALLVKLDSKGGVFFVQERIGVDHNPFKMWKFRTMRSDAEQMLAEVEAFNESGVGLFKMKKDPRVTRVGRLLRRLSLDELPQLFNVLKGDMRIVGPRPLPRRDFEQYYEEWHYGRHSGMPGLTCLWQTSGRSEIGFENMCILDVYYLRNQSWSLDLRILLKTVWVVLFSKGAY